MQLRSVKFLAVLCLLGAGAPQARAADPALEKQVKSAFVVNFIQFIDWPATAFDKPDDPIIIGVVDGGNLGDALPAAIEGKTVRGRKLVLRPFTPTTVGKCHVLIVGNLGGDLLSGVLQTAAANGTLTIGESEHLTDAGGIIQFYLEDRKVRFEINQAGAERAHLQISSKLLKLARVVNK